MVKVRQRHLGAIVGHKNASSGIRYLYRAAIEFALLWLHAIHWHAAIEAAQKQIVGLGSGQNQLLRKRGTVRASVCAECVCRAAVDVCHAWAAGWEVYDVLGGHACDFVRMASHQSKILPRFFTGAMQKRCFSEGMGWPARRDSNPRPIA